MHHMHHARLQQASRSMASCNVEKEQLGQIYLTFMTHEVKPNAGKYCIHGAFGYWVLQKHSTKTKT